MAEVERLPKFNEAELKRIADVVREKGGYRPCPICSKANWGVAPGAVHLVMQPRGEESLRVDGDVLPSVVFICGTCGYTFLMNVFVLGLGDLFGVKRLSEEHSQKKEAPSSAEAPTPAG